MKNLITAIVLTLTATSVVADQKTYDAILEEGNHIAWCAGFTEDLVSDKLEEIIDQFGEEKTEQVLEYHDLYTSANWQFFYDVLLGKYNKGLTRIERQRLRNWAEESTYNVYTMADWDKTWDRTIGQNIAIFDEKCKQKVEFIT